MFTEFIEKNVKMFIIADNSKAYNMDATERVQTSFFLNIKNKSNEEKVEKKKCCWFYLIFKLYIKNNFYFIYKKNKK